MGEKTCKILQFGDEMSRERDGNRRFFSFSDFEMEKER
jgi:hypothetical protein